MWIFFLVFGAIELAVGVSCITAGSSSNDPAGFYAGFALFAGSFLWFGIADALWTLGQILITLDAAAKYQRERDKSFL